MRVREAQKLIRRLRPHLQGKLHLVVTDNKAVMITVQRDPRHATYLVRLHHLFVDAPDPVLRALARYIGFNDRRASRELNLYIDQRQERIQPGSAASLCHQPIRTDGRVHDLRALFDELNARYFNNQVRCRITWGRHVRRGRIRRSIKLGSYTLEDHLIRIHPGLDQEWVPRFYVQWVIYHEMLHALHGAPVIKGRHSFHTPAFTDEERRFSEYRTALAWERGNVATLLCI
jgi:hypothetical protein